MNTYIVKLQSLIRGYNYRKNNLPNSIKSTTTTTADNTGNLTMCVYAITNYIIYIDK